MPPAPSKVSDQFSPVDSTGRSSMVICTHCRTQKIPRNSLQRKEEHLRGCAAFALSPLFTALNSNGQNLLDASIAARSTRTKPGNLKINQGRNWKAHVGRPAGTGAAAASVAGGMALQERVERIIRGEGGGGGASASVSAQRATSEGFVSPYASTSSYAFSDATPAPENMSALLESAAAAAAANPRKRPLDPSSDRDTPSTDTPDAVATPPPTRADARQQSAKRFKNAELYLDEDDFDFVCSARTDRELKLAALVERLARLVRLRDTR